LVFEKNANFFAENRAKIAENNDHNIDPRKNFKSSDALNLPDTFGL
jgi:hypothetical protein